MDRAGFSSLVFNAWKNSHGHNANMLGSEWTKVGIGAYRDDAHGMVYVVFVAGN